jgi:helix-turn-helix protein
MSVRELQRVEVMARVAKGNLTLVDAAALVGLSYRQTKRVWRVYRRKGATALQHGSTGRRSNRATPRAVRRRALALIRAKYGGDTTTRFGPTLAAEHLAEEDGMAVHAETLRRWMLAEGLWSRTRKAAAHRSRRARKAHCGELLQLDGSFHAWLEDRGAVGCLMDLVDDATGRSVLHFSAEETTWAAVTVLRRWVTQYGIPRCLYTDWKTVYLRAATEAERLSDTVPLTQFGRMCATLGIRIIGASSPQAKGRVERQHGTHQDRLVKKLRRHGVTTYAAADAYLETTYTADHNRRFAIAPTAPEDFHLAVPRGLSLDTVFRLQEDRTIGNDWVVRYDNRFFQLTRQSGYAPARSKVQVCEAADGQLEIRYRGQRIAWEEIASPPPRVRPPTPVTAAPRPAPHPTRAAADHPWRQGYKGVRADVPLWQVADR